MDGHYIHNNIHKHTAHGLSLNEDFTSQAIQWDSAHKQVNLIKQSNQTKLKISLISLCGLNIKNVPCELEEPPAFSYFHLFLIVFGSVMGPSTGPGQLSQQY